MFYAVLSFKRSLKKRHINVAWATKKSNGMFILYEVKFNKDGQRRRHFYPITWCDDETVLRGELRVLACMRKASLRIFRGESCST